MDIDKILEGFGIKSESLEQVRLGRGVIGKSAALAAILLIIFAIAAYRVQSDLLVIVIVLAAILVWCIFFFWSMKYAKENPGAALLEGAELITWRSQELAAKSIPNPPKTPSIPDPTRIKIEGPNANG